MFFLSFSLTPVFRVGFVKINKPIWVEEKKLVTREHKVADWKQIWVSISYGTTWNSSSDLMLLIGRWNVYRWWFCLKRLSFYRFLTGLKWAFPAKNFWAKTKMVGNTLVTIYGAKKWSGNQNTRRFGKLKRNKNGWVCSCCFYTVVSFLYCVNFIGLHRCRRKNWNGKKNGKRKRFHQL